MRTFFVCLMMALGTFSSASAQQTTALRRTQVANDLVRMHDRNPGLFTAIVEQMAGGDSILNFLSTATPDSAPSLSLLETTAQKVKDAGLSGFGGGMNPWADIQLSAGAVGEALAPAVPTSALILQASAEFLAGRVKDELAIEYVETMQRLMQRPVVDDLTHHSRSAISLVESTSYRAVLPMLRQAALRDLRSAPARLTTQTTYSDVDWGPSRDVLSLASVAVRISNDILSARPVLDVLADLEGLDTLSADALVSPDLGAVGPDAPRTALILTGLMAGEFRAHQENADSIIGEGPRSPIFFASFLAADVTREDERFAGLTNRTQIARAITVNARFLLQILDDLDELNSLVEAAKQAPSDETAARYFDIMSFAARLPAQNRIFLPDTLRAEADTLQLVIQSFADAYADWGAANYTGMVVDLMSVADILHAEFLGPDARKFFMFAATLADAETSDEMVAVLEASALPAGGYRVKRADAAIGITAYGGGAGYYEEVEGDGTAAGGLAFPIGVEFSFPFGDGKSSMSFFLSAIDVGNLVSLRESEGAPDVRLEQVFAPGVGVQFGLGSSPWSAGALLQTVPNLRTDDGGSHRDAVRLGIFAGIEMPLFRFWRNADD